MTKTKPDPAEEFELQDVDYTDPTKSRDSKIQQLQQENEQLQETILGHKYTFDELVKANKKLGEKAKAGQQLYDALNNEALNDCPISCAECYVEHGKYCSKYFALKAWEDLKGGE